MSKRDCAVSPKKEPRKQSKKPKKIIVFSTENKNKFKIKLKMAALCYASKKPIHKTYIITSSRCFHEKKIKLKIRNRKSLIVHHPKTDQKNNPNSWIRTTPALNNCIFVCRCLFLSKKIPSCTLTKRNEWTHTHITKSAAQNQLLYMQCPKIQCWIHTT